ncbi:MAG: HD domain-containing protein [Clostridia bacterium]|nr:HD domain-containing protein [Clostridia bacterium]
MTERYLKALEFATKKHKGQFRSGGLEYVTHPIAVAEILKEKGYGEDEQIAGLFHDLLEDTDATEDEILTLGGENVLTAVKLLTKAKGYVMSEYISGILANPIAKAVKGADRLHNLRCAVVCSDEFKKRYIKESNEWYLSFDEEIKVAVKALEETL